MSCKETTWQRKGILFRGNNKGNTANSITNKKNQAEKMPTRGGREGEEKQKKGSKNRDLECALYI